MTCATGFGVGVGAWVLLNGAGVSGLALDVERAPGAKELPRILKEGLSSKKLKSKGQKRPTTYFAAYRAGAVLPAVQRWPRPAPPVVASRRHHRRATLPS